MLEYRLALLTEFPLAAGQIQSDGQAAADTDRRSLMTAPRHGTIAVPSQLDSLSLTCRKLAGSV